VSAPGWLPGAVLACSFVPGVVIFFLREENQRARTLLNLGGALLKVALVVWMLLLVHAGEVFEMRFSMLPGVDLVLHADAMSLLFVTLSTLLWLLTTIYAIGYLEGSPNRSRFFGFFSLCVTATSGIALAGNLVTLFVFYELLTLMTYPLVVHRGTVESLAAGRTYLTYTLSGGIVLLIAVIWLRTLVGPVEFTTGGMIATGAPVATQTLTILFVLFVVGFGVKAAIVPLHGWLPRAMVAPAPVSALLHAVAVVKAGIFGLMRIVYDVYGIEFSESLGVLTPLAGLAAISIIWGSFRALQQDELKKRLAYSTVSQVSYIAFGIGIFGPLATIGALVHLVHQGLMKITLFFCAGNLAETLGIHHVSEMRGVGRRMPLTMGAFTIGALGMIGVPPIAGFITKWYIGTGALAADAHWVLAVLAVSTVLNAAYFLPVLHTVWFEEPAAEWSCDARSCGEAETKWLLLGPPLFTAAAALAVGLLAGLPVSPLGWAELITSLEFAN
jgi:multicomponent Na+:H+ antiporter subunit D